jgi:hypothetical protein
MSGMLNRHSQLLLVMHLLTHSTVDHTTGVSGVDFLASSPLCYNTRILSPNSDKRLSFETSFISIWIMRDCGQEQS